MKEKPGPKATYWEAVDGTVDGALESGKWEVGSGKWEVGKIVSNTVVPPSDFVLPTSLKGVMQVMANNDGLRQTKMVIHRKIWAFVEKN